ncbi:MAG: hypothetical protein GY862_17935 [Gammaproteobacteria bacterium]|nr:hypothetical protein [Gammaproteobacteria bacterium]
MVSYRQAIGEVAGQTLENDNSFREARDAFSESARNQDDFDEYKEAQDVYRSFLDSLLPDDFVFDFEKLNGTQTDLNDAQINFDTKQTDLDAKQIVKLNNFASPSLIHILKRGQVFVIIKKVEE